MTPKQERMLGDCVETIVDTDSIIDVIRAEFDPEDIFSVQTLEEWAEANGYIKE
jgi:hypothetical protein